MEGGIWWWKRKCGEQFIIELASAVGMGLILLRASEEACGMPLRTVSPKLAG